MISPELLSTTIQAFPWSGTSYGGTRMIHLGFCFLDPFQDFMFSLLRTESLHYSSRFSAFVPYVRGAAVSKTSLENQLHTTRKPTTYGGYPSGSQDPQHRSRDSRYFLYLGDDLVVKFSTNFSLGKSRTLGSLSRVFSCLTASMGD
jgi:hypothetical protein